MNESKCLKILHISVHINLENTELKLTRNETLPNLKYLLLGLRISILSISFLFLLYFTLQILMISNFKACWLEHMRHLEENINKRF